MARFLLSNYHELCYNLLRMYELFSTTNYKEFLRQHIARSDDSMTEIAEAAGCQRSYLSRILSSEIQLTPEHSFNLSEYWHFSVVEKEYFLLMVDYARAGTAALKKHLQNKMNMIRQEQESLKNVVNRPKAKMDGSSSIYYSAWYWSAIHIATSIPELQSIDALSKKLYLPPALIERCLLTMKDMGFVKQAGKKWQYAGTELHAGADTVYVIHHHQNWRNQAVISSQLAQPENIHFTVVQSMSREAYVKIRQSLLAQIRTASQVAGPSTEEELVTLNIDLFKLLV